MAVAVTEAKRRSGHGWAPSASATVYLSGSSRAYLRYAQAYRFPSMFESTVGFSASLNPLSDLKPERIHSWEPAFIQDLRRSDDRRVGKAWFSTCISRWSPYHYIQKS